MDVHYQCNIFATRKPPPKSGDFKISIDHGAMRKVASKGRDLKRKIGQETVQHIKFLQVQFIFRNDLQQVRELGTHDALTCHAHGLDVMKKKRGKSKIAERDLKHIYSSNETCLIALEVFSATFSESLKLMDLKLHETYHLK